MTSTLIIKTAIFIAVFLCFTKSNAQEYNNWLLSGGAVLSFDTSPATLICNDKDNHSNAYNNYTVSLSDDNGDLILYGFLEYNENTNQSTYVIKSADARSLITIPSPNSRNVIGCKLPLGGYYIAGVFTNTNDPFYSALYIYKFDNNGNLDREYIYDEGHYCFFIDFVRIDDFIALIAYRNNQIETYKLSANGCFLWNTSEIKLDKFIAIEPTIFDVEHSSDNTQIIATAFDVAFVLNFNEYNGAVTLYRRFESNKFRTMSFSPTNRYFLIIDDVKLKGFRYDKDFDFVLDNPDIIYDLPMNDNNVVCNHCWEMAVGVDGKIYLHHQNNDYILVLDGIESGSITEEIIQSECLNLAFFPRIPRISDCKASAHFDYVSVCYGEPLNVMLSGTAPFEVFYTLNGEAKSFKTDNMEYQMPNISGKYIITKIKDNKCETLKHYNNTAIIAPNFKKVKIMEKN